MLRRIESLERRVPRHQSECVCGAPVVLLGDDEPAPTRCPVCGGREPSIVRVVEELVTASDTVALDFAPTEPMPRWSESALPPAPPAVVPSGGGGLREYGRWRSPASVGMRRALRKR